MQEGQRQRERKGREAQGETDRQGHLVTWGGNSEMEEQSDMRSQDQAGRWRHLQQDPYFHSETERYRERLRDAERDIEKYRNRESNTHTDSHRHMYSARERIIERAFLPDPSTSGL